MKHVISEDRTALARRASLLHLSALSLAEGMRSGTFSSLYRGQGIEFSGVRDYLHGDDVRAIDWNVTARMGRPYVKLFEEEHELDVFLVVDKSLSMNSGSGNKSRLETALECASLLTLASEQNNSPVGAVLFDGSISFSCAPKAGKNQSLMLLTRFDECVSQSENGSALGSALQGAGQLLKKRTLVLVISDFRTTSWEQAFGQLCAKHDVVAICIKDPIDDELPDVGAIPFCDLETGCREVLPTSSVPFRRAWRDNNSKRLEDWSDLCIRHGGIPLVIKTDSDPAVELTNFFKLREQR
jgi:uncharacterized protein (DUF58 family)